MTASGALDTYTVAQFRRATLRPDIAQTDLAVDLNAVTLIDSSGLHALQALRNRAQAAGHRLDLVCTRRDLMSALAIAGLKAGRLASGRTGSKARVMPETPGRRNGRRESSRSTVHQR